MSASKRPVRTRIAYFWLAALLCCTASARSEELVSDVLRPYKDRVEEAIRSGFEFLVRTQTPEGFFPDSRGKTTGVVSLVGLAYLAMGHTPGSAEYGESLRLCIEYVLSNQMDNGMLVTGGHGHHNSGGMYSHTIAALFLSEVSGMVDEDMQERIDTALSKATRLILVAQQIRKSDMHRGGWRYNWNSSDSDLSCSGWALMALRSAKLNGAAVPDKSIADAVRYIMRNGDETRGMFGYQNPASHHVTLTGAALLCLELTGHHGQDITRRAGDHILNVHEQLPHQGHAAYGVYYAAQGTFQLGGKYWKRFAPWMYETYLPRQRDDGRWEGGQGSTYTTAMTILAFAVPYRQLPIYQRDETVGSEE